MYGVVSFESYFDHLEKKYPEAELNYFQSNHEGEIIDYLHLHGFESETGIILNAGGLSHTSISLRDAVETIETPVIEIHITDISKRETFRQHSFLTVVCVAHFIGQGLLGYDSGIEYLLAPE